MVKRNFSLIYYSFSLWALCLCLILSCTYSNVYAQEAPANPREKNIQEIFLPFSTHPISSYRSPSGKPSKNYWQNGADYALEVTLDDYNHQIAATVSITYTNNSPDDLEYLWLQLDQNLFKTLSKGALTTSPMGSRFGNQQFDGGYNLKHIGLNHNGINYLPEYEVYDTRMKIDLKNTLFSHGDRLKIVINFSFKIPPYGSDRMGRMETKNGWIYQLAQWYPRMAVYDDIKGWNTLPYLGAGEFYLEYGNFNLKITAPANHAVIASGKLVNAKEVLNKKELKRWKSAHNSDQTIMIRDENDMKNYASQTTRKTKTWHYQMENTRDVSWASSKAFIWDAASINLPSKQRALATSLYPIESKGNNGWERSTEYTKASIEHYSYQWFEYPYPMAANVAGIVAGMEYPGLSFCSWKSKGEGLWGVTDHEFGHNWFPMIVGSNEREYAFMDEGFNTFINHYSTIKFNNGEYSQNLITKNIQQAAFFSISNDFEPIISPPDQLKEGLTFGFAAYLMPAYGLIILRESIIGKERFDKAFMGYIHRWAYKHPTFEDFCNTIEDITGEELDWFWRGWFQKGYSFDQGIKDTLSYKEDNPLNGAYITVENLSDMVFPIHMTVNEENGKKHNIKLPVEVWHHGNTWIAYVKTTSKITKVVLNPYYEFPDINPINNIWPNRQKKATQEIND